jgi:hypothetical protein
VQALQFLELAILESSLDRLDRLDEAIPWQGCLGASSRPLPPRGECSERHCQERRGRAQTQAYCLAISAQTSGDTPASPVPMLASGPSFAIRRRRVTWSSAMHANVA